MKASKDTICLTDTQICMISEYHNSQKEAFDCSITHINDNGVGVCYLSGYKSRNDFVVYTDVIAKLDLTVPRIDGVGGCFSGPFVIFERDLLDLIGTHQLVESRRFMCGTTSFQSATGAMVTVTQVDEDTHQVLVNFGDRLTDWFHRSIIDQCFIKMEN